MNELEYDEKTSIWIAEVGEDRLVISATLFDRHIQECLTFWKATSPMPELYAAARKECRRWFYWDEAVDQGLKRSRKDDDTRLVYSANPPIWQGEYRYSDGRILVVEVEVGIVQDHINAYFTQRAITKPTMDERREAEAHIARFGYWHYGAAYDQSRIRRLGTGWQGRAWTQR